MGSLGCVDQRWHFLVLMPGFDDAPSMAHIRFAEVRLVPNASAHVPTSTARAARHALL